MTARLLTLALLALTACGKGQGGFTECGEFNTCQPGQYCEDPTFGECVAGCLSNENCANDQVCALPPGRSVGSCENEGKNSGGGPGDTYEGYSYTYIGELSDWAGTWNLELDYSADCEDGEVSYLTTHTFEVWGSDSSLEAHVGYLHMLTGTASEDRLTLTGQLPLLDGNRREASVTGPTVTLRSTEIAGPDDLSGDLTGMYGNVFDDCTLTAATFTMWR